MDDIHRPKAVIMHHGCLTREQAEALGRAAQQRLGELVNAPPATEGEPLYRSHGKQVLLKDLHFADAATEGAAKRIADAMNRVHTRDQLCHPLCILSG